MDQCPHLHVKILTIRVAVETHDQPAEWDSIAECQDCGKHMDVDDIPVEATITN